MPAMRTLPASGSRKPVIIFMVVDLPAPLGPRKPSTSPRTTSSDMPSTATISPKRLRKSLASINTAMRFLLRPSPAVLGQRDYEVFGFVKNGFGPAKPSGFFVLPRAYLGG